MRMWTRRVWAQAILSTLLLLGGAQAQRVTLEFWHSMGGVLGEATEKLVQDFNKSQDRIQVKSQYVGSYDDGINKLLAALRAGRGYPHVIQVYDIGARIMADSGAVVPLEDLARKSGFDLGRFLPQPRNYYTVEGKLYGLPFNSSNPILYLNMAAFQEAGIPFKPTWSLKDLEEAARKLTKKDAQGRTVRYGLSIPIDSWFVEQISYNSGEYFCNNENGRKARATAVTFDNPAAAAFLDMYARLVREGVAANTGRNWADSQSLFAQGQAAIAAYSTASLTGVLRQVGNRFPLRTAFYPFLRERNGVAIGGAALYVLKGFPEEQVQAAWEFVRFLLEPETQARWHLATGYFPVVRGVTELPQVRQAHVKQPNYTTAIQQLATSKVNASSAGCLMGAFPEIRQYVQTAWEETLKGKPALEALREAKARADQALERYNRSVAQR
ncbi:sn-glycerol-3-phosphate-binding periplasmic protein UgpB (plasmid) [Thermus thermophilus]|uniref:sn-glycerol-3-phosphate-binding periplasmic protein UgpB n=1 Tax=Thermus thermophilus TaxID=274 RepID=A0A3P4AXA0_THETH|nr:ABC transporter substrate-binding protein [Thermus thermophilus]VCU54633.1 sn-glycerol-3-phosphate-binding periplasmic protein UgpB [Thermus thermophilus]